MKRKITIVSICVFLMLVSIQTTQSQTVEPQSVTSSYDKQVFDKKLTIVDFDKDSFSDDLVYLSAIPTSVYYKGESIHTSALIYDEKSTNSEYLIEDIALIWGDETEIVNIGGVNQKIINEFTTISQPENILSITNPGNTVDSFASEIATNFWQDSNTAVIAPLSNELNTNNLSIENDTSYLDFIQAASNGAIIASMLNCPLLYTQSTLSADTINTLTQLAVEDVILTYPNNYSISNLSQDLTGLGIQVVKSLDNLVDTIQYIRSIRDTNHLTLIYNNFEERLKPWGEEPEITTTTEEVECITSPELEINYNTLNSFLSEFDEINSNTEELQKSTNSHSTNLKPKEKAVLQTIGPFGDEKEMTFGPAAYIGAFHAGPVIAFPTENTFCQMADDKIELLGDFLYQRFLDNNHSDSPSYSDMVAISDDFYAWLNDIGIDQPGQETVIIVGHIGEIHPSLDRAIFGKAISGRIGSDEAPHAACIINRNVLYSELIKVNQGSDALMSFIAYGHGCPFVDNDGVTQNIYESEDVPGFFEDKEWNCLYHTNFAKTCSALNSGVRYYVNSGHAYYGPGGPIFGIGKIAHWRGIDVPRGFDLFGSAKNPDPDGDGYVGMPFEPLLTCMKESDAYLLFSGNLHSASMYWLLCNIGGSQGPVLWQKNGASVVIAAYTAVSFEGGGWFDTIVNQEIANEKTYGEAVLAALRASGSIYSEDKEGLSQDETLQYIVYGDPNLKLIFDNDDVSIEFQQSFYNNQATNEEIESGQQSSNK